MDEYFMLIDGNWVASSNGEFIEVINPATEEPFARIPTATDEDVDQALDAAQRAFPSWSKLSAEKRAEYLLKTSQILNERKCVIQEALSREMGKYAKGAMDEVIKVIETYQFYSEEAKRIHGSIIPNPDPLYQSLVVKKPIGVVAAIASWNYPLELTSWKVAAALAAGCTVVGKAPTEAPISTLMLWRCLFDAGIPRGVINVVTGSGKTVGRRLVSSPIPRRVAFTGSTEVGKEILALTANSIKKVSLELGGQCPLIVSKKCNLKSAVEGATRRSFRNMGQICVAVNRIYVQQDIYEPFLDSFVIETKKLTIGNPLTSPNSDLGPMCNKSGLEKTNEHIRDAVGKGARLLYGGKRPDGDEFRKGFYFEPTILADTNHSMLVMTTETFGPVVGVMPFKTLADAVELANSSNYGLASYVYTDDLNEMHYLTENIESGMVAVNTPDPGFVQAPWGGWKDSGIGYEHAREGLEEYLILKHIRVRYTN